MNLKEISQKYFYFPVIILGFYLAIRLINESSLISIFPLDYTNDISSYLAQLHFLKVCGFHQFCGYWYNGITTFLYTPPAWYFFTLPIYILTKDILFSTYFSIVLIYILSCIGFIVLAKLFKFSYIKGLALFLLFFVSPMAIGEFLRLGRPTTMFAWLFLIPLTGIIFYYKNKVLDKYFYLSFIPLYALLILSHYQEAVLFSILLISLFLIKSNIERIKIIISIIISFLITSFWSIPFLLNVFRGGLMDYPQSRWLLEFKGDMFLTNIVSIVVVLIFLIVLYFNLRYNSRNYKFYIPIIILSILFLTRLIIFIPILKNIAPDPYILFFWFLSLFLLIITKFPEFWNRIISVSLIIGSIIFVVISAFYTPWFSTHTPLENDALSLLNNIDERFIIFGGTSTSYANAYYSYAPIYLNLSSAAGWYRLTTTRDYLNIIKELYNSYNDGDCNNVKYQLKRLNVTDVLAFNEECTNLNRCDFNIYKSKGSVCLYKLED